VCEIKQFIVKKTHSKQLNVEQKKDIEYRTWNHTNKTYTNDAVNIYCLRR